MTWKTQKKAYFLFVINLITRSKQIYRKGRSLKMCGTIHLYQINHKYVIIRAYLEQKSMGPIVNHVKVE